MALALVAAPASAFVTLSGVVSDHFNYTLGKYLSGGTGLSGTGFANSWNWVGDGVFDPTAGDATDYRWVQGGAQNGCIWDLGAKSNMVVAFPSIDHGPITPGVFEESLEFTLYGSNDLVNWNLGSLGFVVADGWVDNGTSIEGDDWASVWNFGSNYQYVKALASYDGDYEMDAVGAASAVPEPGTLLLMGLGLVGGRIFKKWSSR